MERTITDGQHDKGLLELAREFRDACIRFDESCKQADFHNSLNSFFDSLAEINKATDEGGVR